MSKNKRKRGPHPNTTPKANTSVMLEKKGGEIERLVQIIYTYVYPAIASVLLLNVEGIIAFPNLGLLGTFIALLIMVTITYRPVESLVILSIITGNYMITTQVLNANSDSVLLYLIRILSLLIVIYSIDKVFLKERIIKCIRGLQSKEKEE